MNAGKILRPLAAILGVGLCLYPAVARLISKSGAKGVLSTYQNTVESSPDARLRAAEADAAAYNAWLARVESGLGDGGADNSAVKPYEELLNLSGEGIMGSIEIPAIRVNLPICHGTEDDVLRAAVGHLEGTSLPVGGENTHAVLSGHRGLPGAELFTRLDELGRGDLFVIHVGKEALCYRVYDIEVTDPDSDILNIEPGKDKVSLVTCTPYGINTHRLVVTGERVPYVKEDVGAAKSYRPSAGEIILVALPLAMIAILVISGVKRRKKGKSENEEAS